MSDGQRTSTAQREPLWVTHDTRYGTRDSHHSEADARREAAREPGAIRVVAYEPCTGSAPLEVLGRLVHAIETSENIADDTHFEDCMADARKLVTGVAIVPCSSAAPAADDAAYEAAAYADAVRSPAPATPALRELMSRGSSAASPEEDRAVWKTKYTAIQVERDELRAALRTIRNWDMLNPGTAVSGEPLSDGPWLRTLIDGALRCASPDVHGVEAGVAQKVRERSGESTPETAPAAVQAVVEQRACNPPVPGSSPGSSLHSASVPRSSEAPPHPHTAQSYTPEDHQKARAIARIYAGDKWFTGETSEPRLDWFVQCVAASLARERRRSEAARPCTCAVREPLDDVHESGCPAALRPAEAQGDAGVGVLRDACEVLAGQAHAHKGDASRLRAVVVEAFGLIESAASDQLDSIEAWKLLARASDVLEDAIDSKPRRERGQNDGDGSRSVPVGSARYGDALRGRAGLDTTGETGPASDTASAVRCTSAADVRKGRARPGPAAIPTTDALDALSETTAPGASHNGAEGDEGPPDSGDDRKEGASVSPSLSITSSRGQRAEDEEAKGVAAPTTVVGGDRDVAPQGGGARSEAGQDAAPHLLAATAGNAVRVSATDKASPDVALRFYEEQWDSLHANDTISALDALLASVRREEREKTIEECAKVCIALQTSATSVAAYQIRALASTDSVSETEGGE